MSPKPAPEEIAREMAKRLTMQRLEKTWTRSELAERAGINVYTLKRFERSGQISLERLIAICQALGCYDEIERLFKPRQRVDIEKWQVQQTKARQRGRRRIAVAVE
ncbi:MAG: helix-turn-helix transcriptional regulator [Gammaproteobacteria bacterium]|nr:helix-turn-helix transcriptional regulator [Gammaproteobacteria bacterium]